jgi:hypothetical protein
MGVSLRTVHNAMAELKRENCLSVNRRPNSSAVYILAQDFALPVASPFALPVASPPLREVEVVLEAKKPERVNAQTPDPDEAAEYAEFLRARAAQFPPVWSDGRQDLRSAIETRKKPPQREEGHQTTFAGEIAAVALRKRVGGGL